MPKANPGSSIRIPIHPIPFSPWAYFGIFLVSNTLISYFTLSLTVKLWIGFFGLLLPFGIALWTILERPVSGKTSSPKRDWASTASHTWGAPPLVLWFFFVLSLGITRFYKLTDLPFWPNSDEGIFSYLALGQIRDWHWDLLWSHNRLEPLFIWLLGGFFKIFQPSLLSLRVFLALISIFTSLTAYWAARQYFPRALSFIFCCFLTFSFWGLMLSRFCLPHALVPLFLCLAFGCLGWFFKSNHSNSKWLSIIGLSLSSGIGFYTYPGWATVWVALLGIFFIHAFHKKPSDKIFFFSFCLISAALILPLIVARLSPGGMAHYQEKFGGMDFPKFFCLYWISIFWDGLGSFPYGPVWGGFLDSLSGSLAMLGALFAIKKLNRVVLLCFFGALFLSCLPGALSNNIEILRIVPTMFYLVGLSTGGIQCLASSPPKIKPWGWILCLIVLSGLLSFYHFTWCYCDPRLTSTTQEWRSVKYFQIDNILRNKIPETGPLFVFSEFNLDYVNKTLAVPSYSYDRLQNLGYSRTNSSWAALLISSDYQLYLQKKFPHLEQQPLDKGEPQSLALYLIPPDDFNPLTLQAWIQTDQTCREINRQVFNRSPLSSFAQFPEQFKPFEVQFKEDPFLSCIYWEKIAFFESEAGDYRGAARAYQKAIQTGVPTPHLYYCLGRMLELSGEKTKPHLAF